MTSPIDRRIPGRTWMLSILSAVLILVASPVFAQDFTSVSAEIARLEALVTENEYEARQSARLLKGRLEEQLLFDRAFVIDQQDRIVDWRRLAESANASAEEALRSAERWEAQATESNLSEEEQAMRNAWGASYRATVDESRADAMMWAQNADEFEKQVASAEEKIAAILVLIGRLEVVLGHDSPPAPIEIVDGDEVPNFPLEMKLEPFFDQNGYFAGWDSTAVTRRFDIDDHFWDGDASFVMEHIVSEAHEPRRIEKENVVLFFRQLAPSITGHFDLATGTIVQPDHVPHSASGKDLIDHWTWFANETADTLAGNPIHKEQFEPFFREFQHEYRRILKYQAFLSELAVRALSCEHGGIESQRPFYCGRGRLPATGAKARELVAQHRSEMYWAYGVDPWAYMEEIAATSRPEPLRPICVWISESPAVADILAQFQAAYEASGERSQQFWVEADRFYREDWLPHRVVLEEGGPTP